MWRQEGNDMVWDGVEQGIAPSPNKGTANIQNANIATETGEAMASFARFKQDQAAITNGTLTASGGDGAVLLAAPSTLKAGQWITVSSSTIPAVTSTVNYLVLAGGGGGGGANTSEASGGGGAGGLVTGTFSPSLGAYPIVVGTGGAGGTVGVVGTNGGNSYIGLSTAVSFDYLVVGGGGGGAGSPSATDSSAGGGGGAGQVATGTSAQSAGSFSIVVGAGGAGGVGAVGSSGVASSVFGITAAAGGGGGFAGANGVAGASGGGGGSGTGIGGAATAGFAGGNGAASGANRSAGGGGGAGAVGANGVSNVGGAGGVGVSSSISGSALFYGGGGGGGAGTTSGGGTAGAGGSSIGGAGGVDANGAAGTANRGAGGGGSGDTGTSTVRNGGAGGSGRVVLRFLTAAVAYTQTGGTVTTDGSSTVITWNASGTFQFASVTIAIGGGGGATPAGGGGAAGGSGGGGSSGGTTTAGSGTAGQGNNGGTGDEGGGANEAGGGGGGAGAVGSNAAAPNAGNGGNGSSSSISGTATTYAGGGGGGAVTGTRGTGGTGGGGAGSSGAGQTPEAGTDGLGGGGGGGTTGGLTGGDGGNGVIIISYTTGAMSATGGAITFSGGNTIHTFYLTGTFTVTSVATSGQYFVSYKNSSNKVKLSAIYDPYGLYPIAHGTTGTATFSTLTTVNQAISKATEKYNTDDSVEYRYYILDDNGYVWVYDTQVFSTTLAANGIGEAWMLPDPTNNNAEEFNSLAILNGWLLVLNNSEIQGKPTADLGRIFVILEKDGVDLLLINPFPTHTNYANVGHQGKMHYCDGNYVGEVFPTTSVATGTTNTQTYAAFTGSGTTCTIVDLISGSTPYALSGSGTLVRVPVVIYKNIAGAMPAGITEGTVYYALQSATNPRQFSLYTASTGGSALTVNTVGSGTFVNTFYPIGQQDNTAGTHVTLFQISLHRLNLPVYETAQCLVEIGNTVLVGGKTNTIYPWNQISALPTDLITLPEADVKVMINVNNMAYVFAGNKGNVYITNNSSASLVVKVPDYCAGVPGTVGSYIEPRFTWGDAVYLRGRVYLSILDQTSTKAGNCGGVWSFVPTQNFSYGQDTGIQLRLENQNSYGDYDGVATILIANEQQDVVGPQYWAAWQNGYSEATSTAFGIDQSDVVPATTFIIETDLIKVGNYLERKTFRQTEFALTSPLIAGESVALSWRTNSTAAWTAFPTQINDGSNVISGYYTQNLQAYQWLQIRAVVTTNGAANSSFGRFKEIRVR